MSTNKKPPFKATIVPVTPFQQNCIVLWCTETSDAVIIDPGGDVARIVAAVNEANVTVKAVWLTHGHIDHAGGALDIKEALGVEIIGPHEDDRFLLDSLERTGADYGIVGARDVTPDRWLNDGDRVSIGQVTFDCLHCPGHAPGHVIFVNGPARFGVFGDVLFQGSIGRTDLPGGDHETLLRSIRQKVFPLGDDMTFLCGHGPASTIGQERASNPFVGEGAL